MRELVPDVVAHERERTRPQIGNANDVGQDPIAVELQQRDQVQQQHEVVENHEPIQRVASEPCGHAHNTSAAAPVATISK